MLFRCGMVRLSLKLVAAPDQTATLAAALRPLLAEAYSQRACSDCWLAADLFRSNTLHYVEEWSTEADLRADIATGRFRRLAEVMEAASTPPVFKVEFVDRTYGLDYIEAALGGQP